MFKMIYYRLRAGYNYRCRNQYRNAWDSNDDWEQLPSGFTVRVESLTSQISNTFYSGDVLPSGHRIGT